ncbi:MAG TPA: hypothetical protein VMT53_08310 [Terriglobales bacterium]|nr:hypothetical protein [Terriglobales bacterium]
MLLSFLAGMLCGAALLIAIILVSDRSFLDLISGRLAADGHGSAKRVQSIEVKTQRSVAVGSGS